MAKMSTSTKITKAELIFEEDGIKIIEHQKESDVEYSLEEILRVYEGKANLNISISTDREL